MGGPVWFDKTVQACQGSTSFIAYERGLVIFEYSCFSQFGGGSLMLSVLYPWYMARHNPPAIEDLLYGLTVS
jgi:hypothetical protein